MHTPGPWTTQPCSNGGLFIVRGDFSHQQSSIQIVPETDARLMAAAPDLLHALRLLRLDAIRLCDRHAGGAYEDNCREAIAVADAAIAIAEGRS